MPDVVQELWGFCGVGGHHIQLTVPVGEREVDY